MRGAIGGASALIFIYLYWRMSGMFQCNLSKYARYIPDLVSASAASIDIHLSHPAGAETVPAGSGNKINWEFLTFIHPFIHRFLLLSNASGVQVYELEKRNWLALTI